MKEWLYVCSLLSFWGLSLTDRVPTSGASIPLPPKTTNITTHFNRCFLGKKANWSPHNKSRLEYFLSIYLCIWLHQGLECSRQDLPCSMLDLSLWSTGSRAHGLSGWGAWALLSCGMWDLSSLIRDQTCVPYAGRQILNHWTAKEVPGVLPYFWCPVYLQYVTWWFLTIWTRLWIC